MAEGPPTIEPALAPAAAVLEQRALTPAVAALPTILPTVQPFVPPPPQPDTSRFTATWFLKPETLPDTRTEYHHFKDILAEHNRRLPSLRKFRSAILAYCTAECDALLAGTDAPTNFLQTMVATHQECLVNGLKPAGVNRTYTGDGTIDDMRRRLIGDMAWGKPGAYDPWNGWWAGFFDSDVVTKPKTYRQLHIWEPEITLDVMASYPPQQVQAVTQIDFHPDDVKPDDRENFAWFASADELLAFPFRANFPNYAINVWSSQDGLTGYVTKKLYTGNAKVMPHIGFLIDPDVLIWVAFEEQRPGDNKDVRCNISLFAEAGFRGSNFSSTYCIRGGYALQGVYWDKDGNLIVDKKFGKDPTYGHVNDQRANYREVAPYPDFATLERAFNGGFAGSMHPDAFASVDKIANFR